MVAVLIASCCMPSFAFASPKPEPVDSAPVRVEGKLCHPRRLFVQVSPSAREEELARTGARVIRKLDPIGFWIVETPPNRLLSTRAKLRSVSGVARVDLDIAHRPAYDPNDPLWPDQWHMRAINAHTAWDLSFGGPVVVAVIDTGVNVNHPDLAANVWWNTDEVPGNQVDDDLNGYVDDVNGYDFAYNDANPDDIYGHGTPCAGIVAAVQDNAMGCTGVAPKAKIMALKTSIDSGYLYDSANVPAYLYAADNGARVLSMSYFSDDVTPAGQAGINYCWSKGVIPVAAAGNSNSVIPYYPAAYDNCVAVAALNGSLNKAGFSNFGSWVDIAAPGVSLTTLTNGGGYTGGFGGTSGACPHVAGAVALLMGAAPNAPNAEVRAALEDTATLVNQPPYGEFSNYGIVNLQAAMQAILGSPAPPKAAVVRHMSPVGADTAPPTGDLRELRLARIYGRGFQEPRVVEAWIGSQPLFVRKQTRDWFEFYLPPLRGTFTVKVDGQTVSSFALPAEPGLTFSASEASTQDATLVGGFLEMLNPDGQEMTCTRNGDGHTYAQITFRRVRTSGTLKLILQRRYTGTTSGTENVYVYDWASASYPYGSWTLLSSMNVPTTSTRSEWTIPNPGRHVDDEGWMYVVIDASGFNGGAVLRVDQASVVRG